MNNVVWVLIALVNNGHFSNYVVPTLEFKTEKACVVAIQTFKAEVENQDGQAKMRCVRIEK